MFIYIPEPSPREGIAPALEVQIRTHLSDTTTEPAGEAVTISSPQYDTFIAQCTEALQHDKSIDLEVTPASASDAETITIVNDSGITVEDMRETMSDLIGDIPSTGVTITVNNGQYTITLTTVPDLPVLEAHVETLTWSADGHTHPHNNGNRDPRMDPSGPRTNRSLPRWNHPLRRYHLRADPMHPPGDRHHRRSHRHLNTPRPRVTLPPPPFQLLPLKKLGQKPRLWHPQEGRRCAPLPRTNNTARRDRHRDPR